MNKHNLTLFTWKDIKLQEDERFIILMYTGISLLTLFVSIWELIDKNYKSFWLNIALFAFFAAIPILFARNIYKNRQMAWIYKNLEAAEREKYYKSIKKAA